MATLTLDMLYLHVAADPSQFVALDLDAMVVKQNGGATIQAYASGRRRVIKTGGFDESAQLTFDMVPSSTVSILENWAQQATFLLMRDQRGRVFWGFLSSDFTTTEIAGSVPMAQVQVSFVMATFNEGS